MTAKAPILVVSAAAAAAGASAVATDQDQHIGDAQTRADCSTGTTHAAL